MYNKGSSNKTHIEYYNKIISVACTTLSSLPLHVRPFDASWYPDPQLQVKVPAVLVQVWAQLSEFSVHSSMSVQNTRHSITTL